MNILGIESSCDESAAAVVQDGVRVLSSVIASQVDLHAEYGGVVPEIASRAHVSQLTPTISKALCDAGLELGQIDAVAVGHRPGLIGSLLVGVSAAKALAWAMGVPIVGVDHIHAHLYAGLLDQSEAVEMPALGLVVSGGHTAIYKLTSVTDCQLLGATIDDAIGEAYDKAATILGLAYPGGPRLDALASQPDADETVCKLPISRLGKDSLDFSYSGLKTALLYEVRGIPAPGGVFQRDHDALSELHKRDLAACFQNAAVSAVMLKLGHALKQYGECHTLLVGGGVSANSRLRAELVTLASERGLELRLPAMEYCMDNAAMIAGLAWHLHKAGVEDDLTLRAVPTTGCGRS